MSQSRQAGPDRTSPPVAAQPVLFGLGSNLGDRAVLLRRALDALAGECRIAAVSDVWETAPMYDLDQPAFLNLCARAVSDRAPADLLAAAKAIERRLGRQASRRYGPRAIDVDILLLGDLVLAAPGLEIPHPRMAERPFVLVPAAQIAGEWVHPVLGRSIAALARDLPPEAAMRRLGPLG